MEVNGVGGVRGRQRGVRKGGGRVHGVVRAGMWKGNGGGEWEMLGRKQR